MKGINSDAVDWENGTTNFRNDKRIGDIGEMRFNEYLQSYGFDCVKAAFNAKHDFVVDGVRIDVKNNYRENGMIVIEEFHDYATKRQGWIYTSDANVFVFTSAETMIWVGVDALRKHWQRIKRYYPLHHNNSNTRNRYVSAFYAVYLSSLQKALREQVQILPYFPAVATKIRP